MKKEKISTDLTKSIQASEFQWVSPDETYAHSYITPEIIGKIDSLGASSVLDIGCGNGVLTNRVSACVDKIVGVDGSASGISIASQAFPDISFLLAPMDSALPEELRGKFDVVLAAEVIEHLFFPRQLLDRAKEALVPGGYIILTTPYHGYFKNLALALTNKFDKHWHPLRDYGHVKFFSRSTLEDLLVEQGFELISFARVGRWGPVACSMVLTARLKQKL